MSVSRASGRRPDASVPNPARQVFGLAWIGVVLVPVGLAVAMVLGEGAISLLGYPSGGDKVAPVGIAALVGVPATLIGILPGVAAVVYGMRARRAGLPGGLIPAIIGAVVVLYGVVVTIAGLVGLT